MACIDDEEPFPLLFRPAWAAAITEFLGDAARKLEQARLHRRFSFYILTNPLRMKEFGGVCPNFQAGVLVRGSSDVTMETRLEHYPAVYNQLAILLTIIDEDGQVGFTLSSPGEQFPQLSLDRMALAMAAIFETIRQKTDVRLEELVGEFSHAEIRVASTTRETNEILVQLH